MARASATQRRRRAGLRASRLRVDVDVASSSGLVWLGPVCNRASPVGAAAWSVGAARLVTRSALRWLVEWHGV